MLAKFVLGFSNAAISGSVSSLANKYREYIPKTGESIISQISALFMNFLTLKTEI